MCWTADGLVCTRLETTGESLYGSEVIGEENQGMLQATAEAPKQPEDNLSTELGGMIRGRRCWLAFSTYQGKAQLSHSKGEKDGHMGCLSSEEDGLEGYLGESAASIMVFKSEGDE